MGSGPILVMLLGASLSFKYILQMINNGWKHKSLVFTCTEVQACRSKGHKKSVEGGAKGFGISKCPELLSAKEEELWFLS